jgi:hypothetical protein
VALKMRIMKYFFAFVMLLLSFTLSAQIDAPNDILNNARELDRHRETMEIDSLREKKHMSVDKALHKKKKSGLYFETDGEEALTKKNAAPKEKVLGRGKPLSVSWSPDKSFKNVPIEKMNPFVYSQKEMEGFREEYKSRWEKWFGSAPFVFLGMVSSLIIVITLLLRKKK